MANRAPTNRPLTADRIAALEAALSEEAGHRCCAPGCNKRAGWEIEGVLYCGGHAPASVWPVVAVDRVRELEAALAERDKENGDLKGLLRTWIDYAVTGGAADSRCADPTCPENSLIDRTRAALGEPSA